MILDVGPETAAGIAERIQQAATILWNGPLGVFEQEAFANGTQVLAEAIASSDAFSLAGGGDTLAAIDQFGVADAVSYISTGGGAFLEYVEGKELPAVAALKARAENKRGTTHGTDQLEAIIGPCRRARLRRAGVQRQ